MARTFQIPLRPAGRLALGLTVWAIYLADRILDTRTAPYPAEPARHRAYRDYPRTAAALLALALAADLAVSLELLRPQVFRNGLLVLAGVTLYLGALHALPGNLRVPKELLVAALFTVGTFLVAITNSPAPWHTLWRPASAYFLMCLANLVAIDFWEWRELRGALPNDANRIIVRLGRCYLCWVPALAITCAWEGMQGGSRWYQAIAASLFATIFLYVVDRRWPLDLRRALVDGVLFMPALFLVC
ncbi:MAG: hypothetical protein ABI759_28865 [Candidatus Solibacter sp.]